MGGTLVLSPGQSGSQSVACPSGTTALGGGFQAGAGMRVTGSRPGGGGWVVIGTNMGAQNEGMWPYVICAVVS